MLQDSEAGKRLELEALNGTVVELGRRYGLPTSVNADLVRRLLLQQGLSSPGTHFSISPGM
jgi:2-dehydropantoate 2-reductase